MPYLNGTTHACSVLNAPLPLTSGIELVSLQISNILDDMKETASGLIRSLFSKSTLPKAAIIILQTICIIGINSPFYSKIEGNDL